MRLDDCFKKRLLREDRADNFKSRKALEMADLKIARARELFESGFYEESIVSSYTSMFHAARALLFRDGIIERSHACVIAYLSEQFMIKSVPCFPSVFLWIGSGTSHFDQWLKASFVTGFVQLFGIISCISKEPFSRYFHSTPITDPFGPILP